MKPLNDKSAAILAAVPPDGAWIAPWDLEEASGLSLGAYFANVSVLTRRGLVERNERGDYRRTTTAVES